MASLAHESADADAGFCAGNEVALAAAGHQTGLNRSRRSFLVRFLRYKLDRTCPQRTIPSTAPPTIGVWGDDRAESLGNDPDFATHQTG
jgi:hypothetical protein